MKTCGYASVIKHGELGNPQPKWRFTAVRWEKKMGDSPLPGLTLGGYILMRSFFHCWVADATVPHGVKFAPTFGLKLRSVKG